jgi:hypothetical protein
MACYSYRVSGELGEQIIVCNNNNNNNNNNNVHNINGGEAYMKT